MSSSLGLALNDATLGVGVDQVDHPLKKGQRVIYEQEEAEIIRTTPLLVIKTKNRVVCGAIQNRFASVMI